MAKKEHHWHIGDEPPKIELHSLAKHRVYEEYLTHYIQVLNANPRIPKFRLTLIDGFAGGGVYINPQDNSLYPGSPLRLIKAAEAASAAINVKPLVSGQIIK
ncbi:MAG: three-Cys-motif partner protein TcmP [Gammaproteobacteria bacterium]|nr:three-Cys-motif partner protein TcmP [Gammaproteobacteria bacterium]